MDDKKSSPAVAAASHIVVHYDGTGPAVIAIANSDGYQSRDTQYVI